MSLDTGTPNIVLLLAASRDGHTFWVSGVLTRLAVLSILNSSFGHNLGRQIVIGAESSETN